MTVKRHKKNLQERYFQRDYFEKQQTSFKIINRFHIALWM
jgi:hypothetical protein